MNDLTLVLVVVLAMFAYMGWLHRTTDSEQYHTQKRQVGVFQTAASIFTVVGAPHFAFITALAYFAGLWPVSFYAGSFVGFFILSRIAGRIRSYIAGDAQSLPDVASEQVGRIAGRIVTALGLFFLLGVTIVQIVVGATIVTSIAQVDYSIAVILITGAVLCYLIWGGYRALLFTDAIQATMMLVLTGILAWYLWESAAVDNVVHLSSALRRSELAVPLIPMLALAGVILELGAPQNWQRILTAKTDDAAAQSLLAGGLAILVWGILVVLAGNAVADLRPDAVASTAFVEFVTTALPPWMIGLVVVLLLAALISTSDSALFVAAVICHKERNRLAATDVQSMPIGTSQLFLLGLGALATIGALSLPTIVNTFGALLNLGFILGPAMLWIVLSRGGRTRDTRERHFAVAIFLAFILFGLVWLFAGDFFTWWSLLIVAGAGWPIVLPGRREVVDEPPPATSRETIR